MMVTLAEEAMAAVVEVYHPQTLALHRHLRDDEGDSLPDPSLFLRWLKRNRFLVYKGWGSEEDPERLQRYQNYVDRVFGTDTPEESMTKREFWQTFRDRVSSDVQFGFFDFYQNQTGKNPLRVFYTNTSFSYDAGNYEPLRRTTWLVHFSLRAREIAVQGFKRGIADLNRLGNTGRSHNGEFKDDGYAFCYQALAPGAQRETEERRFARAPHFVMFQSAGAEAYHFGDKETQVVVWGPSVDPATMILVLWDGKKWCVMARARLDGIDLKKPASFRKAAVFSSDEYERVIEWVQTNEHQYRRLLYPGEGWRPDEVPSMEDRRRIKAQSRRARASMGHW